MAKAIKNCSTCEHAKYDDIWGEYKCCLHHHKCGETELNKGCPSWEKKTSE